MTRVLNRNIAIICILFFQTAQQNNGQNIDPLTSQTTLWSHDEIDRMVKARLDLPIVEKLRKAGFSMAVIR